MPPIPPERDIVSRVFQNVPDAWYTRTGCLPLERVMNAFIPAWAKFMTDMPISPPSLNFMPVQANAFMTHSSSVPGLTGAPAAPQTTQP